MAMTNGAGTYAQIPGVNGGAPLSGHEPSVVMVNFGLKARHIWAIFAGIPTGLAALGTAGYLALPASKTELTQVERSFTEFKTQIVQEIGTLKGGNIEIVAAVRELKDVVAELRGSPPLSAPAPRPRPAARLAQPPAPKKTPGLFDF
jgi:hypothetical protein